MTNKMPPCCARREAKLTMDKSLLARIAKRAGSAQARNHDISGYRDQILKTKEAILDDKQAIIDHEAEHAGDSK